MTGSLYDFRADTAMACPHEGCGWLGTFGELSVELPSLDVITYDCPRCVTTVVTLAPPTLAQVRVGAAAGHPDAVAHLPKVEELELRRLSYLETLLRAPSDLAELGLVAPTRFVWDVESEDHASWTAARTSVIATTDGREAGRESAPWEAFERAIVVRRLLRARYGPSFGGLAFTARALDWLSGERTGVARLLGDPPVIAAASAASYEPVTLLGIRLECANGVKFEDPSTALLAELLRERRSGNAYLILDRLDGTVGDPFAQVYADDDGSWIVEHRDSQVEPVFHAVTRDIDLVRTVLIEWSLRVPGWHNRLTWEPLDLSPRTTTAAVGDAGAS